MKSVHGNTEEIYTKTFIIVLTIVQCKKELSASLPLRL